MKSTNDLTYNIIGAAYKVHQKLGPGLLESTYEACLIHELSKSDYTIENQKPLPVIYDNVKLNTGYRIDLLVENKVIVEIKAIDLLAPIHYAQLLTYLKLSGIPVGLLINFNVVNLQEGIKRLINKTT